MNEYSTKPFFRPLPLLILIEIETVRSINTFEKYIQITEDERLKQPDQYSMDTTITIHTLLYNAMYKLFSTSANKSEREISHDDDDSYYYVGDMHSVVECARRMD